ncbi:MAG TPA: ABC transporter substrate-binding protein [Candidatus Limnocylindria bacterium]|jgi:osmoprotectant transport system substrate-binding protein|nr:ABC transporter substrate-binding protein [Candidatus Limnocylindria bacterium]
MRKHRTLVLGAAMLALIVSACSSGEGGTPGASASGATGSQPAASEATGDLPTITVGSNAFPESTIVAEIYAQALEDAGFTVERNLELGARDVTYPALTSGDIDLMPEYLGGMLAQTYEGSPTSDVEETAQALRDALAGDDLVAFDPTPGTDADGFAVRSETADEFDLTTMSDLAGVADQLTWGVAVECGDNPNCGPGLKEVYGIDLEQLDVQQLQACSTAIAEALNQSNIDVAQVCTTQPEILAFNLVLLEDDKGLAPAQNIVPVVRKEIADAGGDTLESTLNAVSELLTTEELTNLGADIVLNGQSYEEAARQWLEDNGLV